MYHPAGGILQAAAGRWCGGTGGFNNENLPTGNTAKGAGGVIGRLLGLYRKDGGMRVNILRVFIFAFSGV